MVVNSAASRETFAYARWLLKLIVKSHIAVIWAILEYEAGLRDIPGDYATIAFPSLPGRDATVHMCIVVSSRRQRVPAGTASGRQKKFSNLFLSFFLSSRLKILTLAV